MISGLREPCIRQKVLSEPGVIAGRARRFGRRSYEKRNIISVVASGNPAEKLGKVAVVTKGVVAAVLTDLNFEPLDASDIRKSRLLEPLGMVWIDQALLREKGRTWAFAAVDRN